MISCILLIHWNWLHWNSQDISRFTSNVGQIRIIVLPYLKPIIPQDEPTILCILTIFNSNPIEQDTIYLCLWFVKKEEEERNSQVTSRGQMIDFQQTHNSYLNTAALNAKQSHQSLFQSFYWSMRHNIEVSWNNLSFSNASIVQRFKRGGVYLTFHTP